MSENPHTGRTHSAPYRGYGYVPLRLGGGGGGSGGTSQGEWEHNNNNRTLTSRNTSRCRTSMYIPSLQCTMIHRNVPEIFTKGLLIKNYNFERKSYFLSHELLEASHLKFEGSTAYSARLEFLEWVHVRCQVLHR